MKKKAFSLGKKLTMFIILLAVTLSGATNLFAYYYYKKTMEAQFVNLCQNLAKTTAKVVDGDQLARYADTKTTDKAYDDTLAFMRMLKTNNKILYLYVVIPTETGAIYVYDTDESEDRCALGYLEVWYEDFLESSQLFLSGQEVKPIMSNEAFGWLVSVYEPIYNSEGSVAGYVGADFSMDSIVYDRMQFSLFLMMITVIITVLFASVYLYIIRKTIVNPINHMVKAADNFLINQSPEDGEQKSSSSLVGLVVRTNDEIESLAESMKSMELKINEYIHSLNTVTKKAETDFLTGLHNRGFFEKDVASFLRAREGSGEIHAFMMIDLDNFKLINDTYGHAIGDEVLVACAKVMRTIFRNVDEVVRMGGDEFAILCKSVGNIKIVEDKAAALCEACRSMTIEGIADCHITLSVGVSIAPTDGQTYTELYHKADIALYEAKARGRDQYAIFSE